MKYLITGATGQFGALAVRHLLARVPAADIAVSVRDTAKAAPLAAQGIEVRQGDFATGVDLTGVDTLLLVSGDGPDRAATQRAVVEAAAAAGVGHLAYTSVTDADTSPVGLAADHKATEEAIRASGIPFTLLRNGMYHENYTPPLAHGPFTTAAGSGRVASAARDDLAQAAVIALTEDGHRDKVYELTGPEAWTFDELAALAGTTHTAVTPDRREQTLLGFGLPAPVAALLTDIETNIAAGTFAQVRPDLATLLGRPPTGIEDAVKSALS